MWLRRLFGGTAAGATAPTVRVDEAQRRLDAGTALPIDVREPEEWAGGHVAGAVHISLGALEERLAEVPRDRAVLLVCRSGNRIGRATALLHERGYARAANVERGIIAWQGAGLPVTRDTQALVGTGAPPVAGGASTPPERNDA